MTETLMQKVERVNALLEAGEPGNISVDDFMGYTGYKPQSIIDAMNAVLWGQWGFEELSSEIVNTDKGQLAVSNCRVWLAGIEFRPTSWGQSNVTRGAVGDARKGAQTDALKKGLSYFGIGNRAYHGLLENPKENKNAATKKPIQQPTKPATPRAPGQPTQPSTKPPSINETQNSEPNKKNPAQFTKLDEIPSTNVLRAQASAAGVSWKALVKRVTGNPETPDDAISPEYAKQIAGLIKAVKAKNGGEAVKQ